MTPPGRAVPALIALALVVGVAGCGDGPILAAPSAERPTVAPVPSVTPRPPDPQPVVLPRDDAPHDRLTEWWYYTGHLRDDRDRRFGFEYVVFRAERGAFPVTWASHVALTDETGDRFHWAERSEIGPQVDRAPADGANAFAFAVTGDDPTAAAWRMAGSGGLDRLDADVPADGDAAGLGFGLHLALEDSAGRPPMLHDEDGYIDFGPAGGSYYYSRPRMAASGLLSVAGSELRVAGTAWFDHQWGDFISVGGGGWDWFAVNLDDGTDLTISLVRAADGSYPLVYGTLLDSSGRQRHLARDAVSVAVTDRWTSPVTGADYPAGWRISVPDASLVIELQPTVAGQELDTRATTGVVYWEGSQEVRATRAGEAVGGEAYVELTGYPPTR